MDKPVFYSYPAILQYKSDVVHVTFLDLPGCVTFAVDEREAIEEARDVLALHL